jgi:hypothetical protein
VVESRHLVILRGEVKTSLATEPLMWVVVLNDGETYTALEGCKVLFIPDSEGGENMDQYVKENAEGKGIALNITCGEYDVFSGDIIVPDLAEIEG